MKPCRAKYNDLRFRENLFDRHGKDIAAVIVEPICGNMGVILPQLDFLADLRKITQQNRRPSHLRRSHHRFSRRPWRRAKLFKIKPDLTCLGKNLGWRSALGGIWRPREKSWIYSRRSDRFIKRALCRAIRWRSQLGLRHVKQLKKPGAYEFWKLKQKNSKTVSATCLLSTRMRATLNRCRLDDDPYSSVSISRSIRMQRANVIGRDSPDFFTACLSAVSICRRRRSRRCLFRWPIRELI